MLGMTTFPFACVKVKTIIKLPDSHIITFLVLIDFVKDCAVICKFQPGKAQMQICGWYLFHELFNFSGKIFAHTQTTAEYKKNYEKNLSGNFDEFYSEKQTTSALDTTIFKARNFTNVNTLAWKCQERGLTDDEESQN